MKSYISKVIFQKETFKKPYPKFGDKCYLQLVDGKITDLFLMERGRKEDGTEYIILRAEAKELK